MIKIFAEGGYNVFFTYKSSEDVCKNIEQTYSKSQSFVKGYRLDISDPISISAFFAQIYQDGKTPSVLVNSAAFTKNIDTEKFIDISAEELSQIINSNILGTILCMNRFLQILKSDSSGGIKDIINISSNSVHTLNASNLGYTACKAAIENLTKSYGKHFAHIARVNCVAPGLMLTAMTRNSSNSRFQEVKNLTPLDRLCTPSDIAKTVWAIINNLNFINGQIITVDGGRTL